MGSIMILKEIRDLARLQGVKNYSRLKKAELIRAIQPQESNSTCYQTITDCREDSCLWRSDCQAQPDLPRNFSFTTFPPFRNSFQASVNKFWIDLAK